MCPALAKRGRLGELMSEGGRIEPWVTELAEEIGCACRASGEVARLIQARVDDRRRRGPGRVTWLEPYRQAWHEAFGDWPDCKLLARPCKLAEENMTRADDGEAGGYAARERAVRSLKRYLRATPAQYVNLSKWSQQASYWLSAVGERVAM